MEILLLFLLMAQSSKVNGWVKESKKVKGKLDLLKLKIILNIIVLSTFYEGTMSIKLYDDISNTVQ